MAASLWIDTDPSGLVWTGLDCDDDLALLAALALHGRGAIELDSVSICGGNAPLRHTWDDAARLWEFVGWKRTEPSSQAHEDGRGIFKPTMGRGWNEMQPGVSLLRLYHRLFGDDPVTTRGGAGDSTADAEHALSLYLRSSSDDDHIGANQTSRPRRRNVLMLGPPTNLARALSRMSEKTQLDVTEHAHIFLMGGELTNSTLDLNFRSDRRSARQIIQADVPKTIIPIQTCAQVAITSEHLESFGCSAESDLAVCALMSKMRQQVTLMPLFVNPSVKERLPPGGRWTASPGIDRGFVPWDLVALLAVSHPHEFSEWEYHRVSFPECAGGEPCDGTMRSLEDIGPAFGGSDWRGVVRVPHKVRNETRLVELMLDLVGNITTENERPHMSWGYIGDLKGIGIATLSFLYISFRLRRLNR
ncbi:hypothetical protein THAOC_16739 [Thalassiosira oceanica]|uniref:Inosine/uridine-preferring nucleoside hydrolase domain-containing protein n=1 Tax=Thalassiosira oceanica TaxID=159749 RepID=K0SBG7_THAOC|nr:hypothetical protein THAOC_16739 [Thalassiosira oceanica]|eukprot:EJK62640.1 hypothetical protein THAOC_16739 [Thalassiosira oceanica]